MKSIYKLKGVIQHYAWGGTDFIPSLLNQKNPDKKPFAEYWLGAHPNASSVLVGENAKLNEVIEENAQEVLGEEIAQKFGSLPFLFKILDVSQMLSIQVHPSKEVAKVEWQKENETGIPLTASNRNYKDQNHKPELMVALSDFWLLHGFKPEEKLRETLEANKSLSFLLPVFETNGYKGLYEEVMTMPQERVDEILRPVMQSIVPDYENGKLEKKDENFWAARAALTFCKDDHYDRGIFSIYFFNLLHLKIGEAIYQAAGLPHAYLEGQNVEVMANSDNVLRAGLTDKHVDVPELMRHVKFEATHPKVINAADRPVQEFAAPVEEFLLSRHIIEEPQTLLPQTATIAFVYEGEAALKSGTESLPLKAGEAALLLPTTDITISGDATLYVVTTPAHKI